MKKLFLLFFGIVVCMTVFAKNRVYFYEPKTVTLTGIIRIKTFPGAPNYESIETGDDIETGIYLMLDYPIDVANSKNINSDNIPENNIKALQIAINDEANWSDKFIDKHIAATGYLYHAINGHQHTRVLIMANNFKELK